MCRLGLWTVLLFILNFVAQAQTPVKVILDTDMDSDVDDVGALAMLHTLVDHKKAVILAVVVTSDDPYAPLCADAINHYYGRPDIPIGVEKGIELHHHSRYTRKISEEFNRSLNSYEKAENATDLYRRVLSEQPDSSVVIISIGHLTNLRKLLESPPDNNSPFNGKELVSKKVKLWSCMGGRFPAGKEANFYRPDPGSTQIVVQNWPGRVVFAGWEIGNEIITGAEYLKRSIPSKSPVWRAYQLYNNFTGRPSWDQAAVLSVFDDENYYWSVNSKGHVSVYADGSNEWINGEQKHQSYLVEKMNPRELAKFIDSMMAGIFRSGFGPGVPPH